jgi:hypothetical protein
VQTPHRPSRSTLSHAAALAILGIGVVSCTQELTFGAPSEPNAKYCGNSAITLEVGQVAVPNGFWKQCRFKPQSGAQYVLAWVDVRAIDDSRTTVEPEYYEPYPIRLTIAPDGDASVVQSDAVQRAVPVERPAHLPPIRQASAEEFGNTRLRHRTTPFVLDELFTLEDNATGLNRQARIVRVYGDDYVVARWESEVGAQLTPYLVQLDSAMALVQAQAIPTLRSSFVDEVPRSTAAGQHVILLREELSVAMWSLSEVAADSLYTSIETVPFLWTSPARLASTLAHEMTHEFQVMWMHSTRATAGLTTTYGASFWAIEGGANLMSYEMMRRLAGVAPNSNHNWWTPPTDTATKLYQQRAQPAGGVLTDGFESAMGFLRDLTARRVRAGESQEAALRAVSRGAIEGWFGHDGVTQRVGLVPRMQARFGTRWEASTALLDWALGYAGDDLTANEQYQDLNSYRIWDLPPGSSYGWHPDAVLEATAPTMFLFKRYGSPGYARIFDPGTGVHVEIEMYETPVDWKILRIQ